MRFAGGGPVELKQDGDKTRFRMRANSGQPFSHWWWGQFAIDLEDMAIASDKKPVLLDHDSGLRIGYTEKFELTSDGLIVEGVLLNNDLGKSVAEELSDGFPWEASVSVEATKMVTVDAGATEEVNGHELIGPGHIMRGATLREVSFTAVGADENTSVEALADSDFATVEFAATAAEGHESMTDKADAPVVETLSNEQAADAARAETFDGVAQILDLAGDSQIELAKKCIAERLSVVEATRLICVAHRDAPKVELSAEKDVEAVKSERLDEIKAAAQVSLGAGAPAPGDALKTEWENLSESAQGEFWGDFSLFQASKQGVAING